MRKTTGPTDPRFPAFIRRHVEPLLLEWDRFAGTLASGRELDADALRDHAREILLAVADDMATDQTAQQQCDKSQGLRPENSPGLTAAARLHGLGRLAARFSLADLAIEFRALRASVLHSLQVSDVAVTVADISRFNEAIDQVLGVSMAAYAEQIARTMELQQESELRRQLLVHVEAAQEAERRRIALELHDSVGQNLTAMSLCIATLEGHAPDDTTRSQLARLRTLLGAADRDLDHLVFQLRPIALDGCMLADAVAKHAQAWSAMFHVPVDLLVQGLEQADLSEQVEVAVFRLVQEALNNIAKHAQASRVSLAIRRSRSALVVSIEDDGRGFDAQALADARSAPLSFGIAGMRERVQALGGSFSVEAAKGSGCAVLVRIPLSRPA